MNRQFTINDVFMPGITGGEPDRVRQAFHAPDLLSGAEIGQRDNAAEQLGMSYGEADAGWEDASTELKIRKAETVPGADKWVQDAPENVTFLQEDADGLMAVYQSLHDSGFLSQDDLDEGTAQEIAQGGNGIVDTLERSRLANERTDIGAAVLSGAMEPEEARAKLSSIDSRMAALAKRRGDVSGFYSFMEQGYRMVSRDLPQAGYRALEGGLTGASAGAIAGTIAGTVVPVVGNLTGAVGGSVAGGIAGVGAGLARGMYESAQHMEEANFLADLLNEKDDAGNYLDVDEIREKAQLYGMGSALVEMAGDALSAGAAKLIAPFLKTAAANLGGKSLQLFTKDAIKAAIKNKQAWPVMRRFLLGMGAGAAAEGAEEAVQEGVSASIEAWLKNSLNEEGKAYFRDEQEGLFSAETWAAMAESGLEGAKVGAWFVLLPGIAQLFVDAGKVSRAREFAQGVKDVGVVVGNSATAQMAPARMDTFLQTHGLNQTVYIPADAAWQMQTQGTDLVTALGWTQESLEEAASLRHDIAVPLSRLVSRLDTGTLNAVADIMREGPNAMNVFEAEDPNSFLQEDVDAISAAAEEWEFEQDMLDAELDRVRSAITEAVRSVPGLLQQIVGSADTETSVGTYVDTIVSIIEQAANRLRVYGDDVGSIIQKLNVEGLIRGVDGRLHTAEEIEQMVAEEAQAEADRPFWDNVWGRLDADSLKRDFPDARRELAKKHGYGLFSRKGEGIAVDELADILKNAGWLEQDADSSTLVEMLKSKKRPKGRKAGKGGSSLRQMEWVSQASMGAVRSQYENTDAWMKAPNGKPTNLTERQWLQVRTPEFKSWFGDWENDPENASKVVDENGEPKVVWHGTRKAGFDVFDTDGSGKTEGTGAWFAGRKDTAVTYSGTRTEMDVFDDDGELVVEEGYANYPVFLNIRNPYIHSAGGRNWDSIGEVSIYDNETEEYIYNYPDGRPFDFPYEDAAWDYIEDELEDPDHERYEVFWSDDTTDSVAREVRSGYMGDEFDGVIFEDVQDSGRYGDSWPDTDYIVFTPDQVKSATHNVGSFDPYNPSILYQSYTELDDQRRAAVDAWLDAHPDGAEIREQLELHRGTPWEAQAVESILIRIAMRDIMEGRGHPPYETKLGAKSAEGVVKYLRRGEEGLWQYLSEKGMIGEAAKPGLDVNGSFIACRPSDDCARYCYAAKGQYKYVAPAVKSELIAWAVENDPARAAKLIARQYMATMEYDAGKALRLFDKGDITQEWIPLVQELNRRGIRTQVFSKKPEILRQLDPQMNVIMLSIDKTNWSMADEHPDLPIAFVYSGREDLPFLEKNRERFEAHGGVILPVMQGRKTLPKEDLEALPKWSRRYACPIDSGKKTLYNKTTNPGGWKCAHCDRDGGIGCFYGRTALPNYKEIKEDGLFVETGKREETGGRGHIDVANLYELFRAASLEDRQRILDGLALIHAELRERGIDRGQGTLLPTFGGVDGRASLGNRSGAGPDAGTVGIDSDTLEQRAWHGTPHDFDAFTLQAIGSGEGAQAHGWGLYFAQNRKISDEYRKTLTDRYDGKYEVSIAGERAIPWLERELNSAPEDALKKAVAGDVSILKEAAQRILASFERDHRVAKDHYEGLVELVERARNTPKLSISGFLKTVPEGHKDIFKSWANYARARAFNADRRANGKDFLFAINLFFEDFKDQYEHTLRKVETVRGIDWDKIEVKAPKRGQLFEVEIPDNDVLLDEQKPFEEQPEKVKAALLEVREKAKTKQAELEAKLEEAQKTATSSFEDQINLKHLEALIVNQYEVATMQLEGKVGDEIYRHLRRWMGSPRAASEALNTAGIKGITYMGGLDGRCFVVFDDKAIEVIDKYYAMQAATGQTYKTAEIQRLDDGDFIIRLFRGANLSTLAHEISHAVHLEMERLDSEGKGTEALKRDLDTLRRWQSKFDDEAALRAEYDRYYKGLYGVEFDDLDNVGKLAVKQRAQREMVARGFELYLREGEAPTPGMEAVFRRMGKWQKRVYASASQLDVEISDDVREVFDRWLASEEDIAAAAAANDIHGFTAPLLDSLGLQGADRLELEGMISDAMGKASDALRRDRARYRRDHIQQWRDEVEQELANDPVYQARAAMRRTPIDLDAVVDAYGQELADALRAKLPVSMKKGGDNPEALAFDYGFRDAGQMIQAILNRPGTQERRKELLAQKVQDADAQFAAEDYLFEQEELRQREDKVGEALYRLELESRTAMGRPVSPSQQEFEDFGSTEKNRWKIAREQLRTLVSNLLDEKEAQAAIQPDSYRRAASKAMREERKAILAKDWAESVKQNYLVRVNMEAAYQAGRRRDLVNKLRRQAKRFLDSATPDTRARFAVFGLSQKISLFDPTMKMVQNAADKSLDDVREFLEKMKEEGFYTVDAQIPEELFEGQKQSWKLMDWKDLQPYLEGMAVLMHMERESRKANSEAAKQAWREEMDAMAEGILALNPHRNPHADQKKRLDILRFLKGVHASHLKAETIALLLDGDQDMGPVWRAVIAPINRAQTDRDRRMKKARDDMKRLFGVYEASEWVDIRGKRIFVPGLGRGLTKEQMLAVMLNAGNESNLERLRGMGYKDNEIRAIIDMLDERDVRFVQSVWDYLETFRKESFDLEERLSGVRPKAIEAQPLQTRFGELRGGYYPVSYDPQESSKPIDAESLGSLTGSMMPAVDHGSMKQRTATGLGTPLKLTLEVVPNHVAKTLHMLAFREPVRQVARVLNDKAVNAAIESTMGVEISKALKGWLHYVAGERPGVNGWSKALSMLRKNSALYSMGVKLTTILAQFTGLLASTAEIGPRWVAAGLVRTYCRQNPFTVYRETAALSSMMENRMRSVDRDLYEMSTGLMAKGSSNKALDKFVKFQHLQEQYAFLPVGFVQMAFADLPTWQGAYAKAIHEGKSQSEAIEYADAIVTRTQVGGADKDLAGVQTGQELGKIMTQFYSYFSALYQLYARRMTMLKRSGYSKEAWARLATLFLLTGVAEPILSALFTRDTPEDDEDWATWAAQKVFFNPWNMIVGVRDVFGAVESLVDGYGGKSRTASLLNDSIDSGVRFLSQLAKGEDMDPRAALKSGWKGVGLLTGMVNAQELLFLEAFWDWLEDTNPDFEWADLIRRKK